MNDALQEFLNDPLVQNFLDNLMMGDITLATSLVWLAIASLCSIVGGAIGGVLLAGKDLGPQLSAMIGGLFGPAAMIPAAALGLIALKLM